MDQKPPAPEEADPPLSKREDASSFHRLKRDEWSEGAVSSLLDAYESKWVLRNRAKLKGHDWEDVARHVSSRSSCTKTPKTSTQCKNKIESMKKRYRSEVVASDPTSWPLFPRLDLLLRGGGGTANSHPQPQPLMLLDPPQVQLLSSPPPPPPPPRPPSIHLDLHEFNGDGAVAEEEEPAATHVYKDKSEKMGAPESDSCTPACDGGKEKLMIKKKMMKKKRKQHKQKEVAIEVSQTVRWLAEIIIKSEEARMETMRDLERIRAESEAQRARFDLKRTEIIANTQLQIARILVGKGEPIESTLRTGRSS